MAELLTLTTPLVLDPRALSAVQVESLLLNWKDKRIVVIVGDGETQRQFEYTGTVAVTMMTLLNKANLTSNSLHKRVINQLITDGFLAGTISGTPD